MSAGERLKLARELRGLTQTSLADSLSVTQPAISAIESGRLAASDDVVATASLVLGFPVSFFRQHAPTTFPSGSLVLYRARNSVGVREERRARRLAQVMFECTTSVAKNFRAISPRIPQLSDPPETAAAVARDALGLSPDEPIPHLVRALERAGAAVLALPLSPKKIDAFSVWSGEGSPTPIIATMSGKPGDRLRWSIAHELGHLVLHRSIRGSVKDAEREANAFASEFLTPEIAIEDELAPVVTLNSLARLKARWGVSMQALVMRAAGLEIITERQKSYLFMKISKAGWRTREPIDIPVERPVAFLQMAELAFGTPIDTRRVARELNISETLLMDFLALQDGYLSTEVRRDRGADIVPFRRAPPI